MTLTERKNYFINEAKKLGDYEKLTETELANGYCDARDADDTIANAYMAALMIKYWYKIFKWIQDSKSLHMQDVEFVDWLYDSLHIAMKYRAWRDDNKSVKNDPKAVDKVINRCCFSTRGRAYQFVNKDKRKANVVLYSVEANEEQAGDAAALQMNETTEAKGFSGAKDLIEYYLRQNKPIEALILDGIANQDSFTEDTTRGEKDEVLGRRYSYSTSFDLRKLVKHLSSIDQKFIQDYFIKEYALTEVNGNEIFEKIKALPNSKIYKMIEKTFIEIRENKTLLSFISDAI